MNKIDYTLLKEQLKTIEKTTDTLSGKEKQHLIGIGNLLSDMLKENDTPITERKEFYEFIDDTFNIMQQEKSIEDLAELAFGSVEKATEKYKERQEAYERIDSFNSIRMNPPGSIETRQEYFHILSISRDSLQDIFNDEDEEEDIEKEINNLTDNEMTEIQDAMIPTCMPGVPFEILKETVSQLISGKQKKEEQK